MVYIWDKGAVVPESYLSYNLSILENEYKFTRTHVFDPQLNQWLEQRIAELKLLDLITG